MPRNVSVGKIGNPIAVGKSMARRAHSVTTCQFRKNGRQSNPTLGLHGSLLDIPALRVRGRAETVKNSPAAPPTRNCERLSDTARCSATDQDSKRIADCVHRRFRPRMVHVVCTRLATSVQTIEIGEPPPRLRIPGCPVNSAVHFRTAVSCWALKAANYLCRSRKRLKKRMGRISA